MQKNISPAEICMGLVNRHFCPEKSCYPAVGNGLSIDGEGDALTILRINGGVG